MSKSIFTKAERISLERRLNGFRDDKTGIYSARVKPKLIELLEWFKRIKEIKGLLE